MASSEESAPLERAVMYMFGYLTGLFHQANATTNTPHELPVPVVFDGGLFDQAAGDFGLELNGQWHLLELKRTKLGVAAEKAKERTEALLRELGTSISHCKNRDLVIQARESHWFAYAGMRGERGQVSYKDIELERYVEALIPGYFGNRLPAAPTLAKFLFDLLPEGASTGLRLDAFTQYVFYISGSGGDRPNGKNGEPRGPYFVDLSEASDKLVIAQLNATDFYQSTLAEFITAIAKLANLQVIDTGAPAEVHNKTMHAGS